MNISIVNDGARIFSSLACFVVLIFVRWKVDVVLSCACDASNTTVEKYVNLKGPRTQIIGFQGPNTISLMVFGP